MRFELQTRISRNMILARVDITPQNVFNILNYFFNNLKYYSL